MTSPLWAAAVLVAAEVFESRWQSAATIGEIIERVRAVWRHHLILLFLMHPSLWWVLYLYTERNFHGLLLGAIVVMKGSDVAFKIWLAEKVNEGSESSELREVMAMPVSPWMLTLNIVLYPLAVYAALS